jgi:hypothetical protein
MHIGPRQSLETCSVSTELLNARLGTRPVTANETEHINPCAQEATREGDANAAGTDDHNAQSHGSILKSPTKALRGQMAGGYRNERCLKALAHRKTANQTISPR